MRDFDKNDDDFDRLLRQKLDDATAFDEGQKRSWAAIDRRLEAFSMGQTGRVVELRNWKFAVAASVALAAFLGWKSWDLGQKAQLFEQKAAVAESAFQSEKAERAAEQSAFSAKKQAEKAAEFSTPDFNRGIENDRAADQTVSTVSAVVGVPANNRRQQAPEGNTEIGAEKVVGREANNGQKNPPLETGGRQAAKHPPFSVEKGAAANEKIAFEKAPTTPPDPIFSNEKRAEKAAADLVLEAEKAATSGTAKAFSATEKAAAEAGVTAQNVVGGDAGNGGGDAGNSLFEAQKALAEALFQQKLAEQKAAALAEKADSLASVFAILKTEKDSLEAAALAEKAAPAPPPITPVAGRSFGRFRLGTEAVVGRSLPRANGVSALLGQGFRAEFFVKKGLAATASAQFLTYSLMTDSLLRGHHDGRPKGDKPGNPGGPGQGGGHHPPDPSDPSKFKLALVESTQRQRHFSVGLKYNLPTKGWLRPSLEAGATTVFVPEYLLTYRFDEKGGGGPGGKKDNEFKAETIEKALFANIWRAGAGLAVDLPRWEISLAASYQKDFSAADDDRLADLFSVRAGAAFKF